MLCRKWVFYSWSYFIDMIKDILPLCYKVFHNVQPATHCEVLRSFIPLEQHLKHFTKHPVIFSCSNLQWLDNKWLAIDKVLDNVLNCYCMLKTEMFFGRTHSSCLNCRIHKNKDILSTLTFHMFPHSSFSSH